MSRRSPAMVAVIAVALLQSGCSQSKASARDSDEDDMPATASFDPDYGVGKSTRIEGAQYGNLAFIEGEGTPIVFYYPADQRWWQMQIEPLSSHYLTVTISEDSAVPPDDGLVSPTHLIDALDHLKAQLGVESFNLITHSISARIGMELAIRRPDLVNSLVLEEPAWAPTPDMQGPLPPPQQPACELELTNPIDQGTCDFFAMQMGSGRFERLPGAIRQYLLDGPRARAEALAAAAPELATAPAGPPQFDVICDKLGELDFPILFVRGENTPDFFAAGMDYYESCLPEHDTAIIPNATHMVHFENPQAYNVALRSFLESHSD